MQFTINTVIILAYINVENIHRKHRNIALVRATIWIYYFFLGYKTFIKIQSSLPDDPKRISF